MTAKEFAARESALEAQKIAAHARRRPWSRNDSARWLDERTPAILARMRRSGALCPPNVFQAGCWLKDRHLPLFNLAHTRLAAATDDSARAALHVGDLLP